MEKWKITHNDLEPSCTTLLGTLPLILLTSTNAFLPTFELAEKDQLTIKRALKTCYLCLSYKINDS